jgi:hypothetical protein
MSRNLDYEKSSSITKINLRKFMNEHIRVNYIYSTKLRECRREVCASSFGGVIFSFNYIKKIQSHNLHEVMNVVSHRKHESLTKIKVSSDINFHTVTWLWDSFSPGVFSPRRKSVLLWVITGSIFMITFL